MAVWVGESTTQTRKIGFVVKSSTRWFAGEKHSLPDRTEEPVFQKEEAREWLDGSEESAEYDKAGVHREEVSYLGQNEILLRQHVDMARVAHAKQSFGGPIWWSGLDSIAPVQWAFLLVPKYHQ